MNEYIVDNEEFIDRDIAILFRLKPGSIERIKDIIKDIPRDSAPSGFCISSYLDQPIATNDDCNIIFKRYKHLGICFVRNNIIKPQKDKDKFLLIFDIISNYDESPAKDINNWIYYNESKIKFLEFESDDDAKLWFEVEYGL